MVYHTQEGQSETIAERLAGSFRAAGDIVDAYTAATAPSDISGYDAIVLGGSVHAGKHHKDLVAYARAHAAEFTRKGAAFFSVSLTAVNDDELHRGQIRLVAGEFFNATGWHPRTIAFFGGALKYREYGFLKRRLMRVIARREGGPTDTSRDWDLTDWDKVDAFAGEVAASIGAPARATA